jgi:zinc protease
MASATHSLPAPDNVTRVELPNGITVLARENFTSPSVIVDGMLYAGGLLDPDDKVGLASFHSQMLTRGTEHYTFDQLYEEIEGIAASLDTSSSGHTSSFNTKSLAEDLPTMLKLLTEVLRRPTFPAEHVEKVRGEILTSLQSLQQNTRRMASRVFHELAYPDHPYHRSLNGIPETVAAITQNDLASFQQHLGPKGTVITIVGAVKALDAVKMVEDALGDWNNPEQSSKVTVAPAEKINEIRRKFTSIPGKSQSDIVLGCVGPTRSASDFQAARMANSIFGVFGMYGRLGDAVRESEGLAYYSFSSLDGGFGPGPWRVNAGVAPKNVHRAVEIIREEMRRLVSEPVTQEELDDNKSFFKGQLVLSLETNEGVAGSLMNMEKYDLGLDYLLKYADMIDSLTISQVQAAAAKYLDPDAFALSVAGS